MGEKRGGFLDRFFRKTQDDVKTYSSFKLTNGWNPTFTSFGENAYASAQARACIHAIANNTAKLTAKHLVLGVEGLKKRDSKTQYLLDTRPNPIMSAFDFYYKMITQLMNKNNAFALIEREPLNLSPTMVIPISYSSVEAIESDGEMFLKFITNDGKQLTLPYVDVIHLRRFYYDKDVFGEDNAALMPTLELINTINDGMSNAVQSSASLRGLLKFTGIVKDSDRERERAAFVTNFLSSANNGGIAAVDNKYEFQPIDSKPQLINKAQMDAVKWEVYSYFNVSDVIINSKWTEDEWNAFYEGVIEPLAIQMSQEFTNKIFRKTEIDKGNRIMFEANRLQYASNTTKISFTNTMITLGLATINEVREVWNMTPIEGGDKRLQTLNVVNADGADKYQGTETEDKEEDLKEGEDIG
jgi:HK97 family phage portal protein